MENLKVYFTEKIDTESFGIDVYHTDIKSYDIEEFLIAEGQINLCSNTAHINLLNDSFVQQVFKHEEIHIEQTIEDRKIEGNRIFNLKL